ARGRGPPAFSIPHSSSAPPPGLPKNSSLPRLPLSVTPKKPSKMPSFNVPCGRRSTLTYAVVPGAPSGADRVRMAPLMAVNARADTRPGDVRRPLNASDRSPAVYPAATALTPPTCHAPLKPEPVLYSGNVRLKPSYTDWARAVCVSVAAVARAAKSPRLLEVRMGAPSSAGRKGGWHLFGKGASHLWPRR